MTLEEALAKIKELETQQSGLQTEKTALLTKRDELLGEVRKLKDKFAKFTDYADRDDLNIQELLDIKTKYEAGDSEAKKNYEAAYNRDKETFERRLKVIEDERKQEREEREKESKEAATARLKADAIAEFSKESLRIRNPEQFWRLFGEGKIQRGDDGKPFVGDEYKKQSIVEYVTALEEEGDNQHHFKPKGGSGSGTGAGAGSGGRSTANPWKAETRNLTEQGRITKQNPELAKRLKAEAGVK